MSIWDDYKSSAQREAVEELVGVAIELAFYAPKGITVADVRTEAERLGLLSGNEKGRDLSFLGVVMRKADLVPTGEWRRSHIPKSHGNLHRVYAAS